MRVVITGASSGIGEPLARHYAGQGAILGLISRRSVAVASGISYPLDVTDEAALARAAKDFIARFGVPDLVIANAGISSCTRGMEHGDVSKLRKMLEVNVAGLASILLSVIPVYIATRLTSDTGAVGRT